MQQKDVWQVKKCLKGEHVLNFVKDTHDDKQEHTMNIALDTSMNLLQ